MKIGNEPIGNLNCTTWRAMKSDSLELRGRENIVDRETFEQHENKILPFCQKERKKERKKTLSQLRRILPARSTDQRDKERGAGYFLGSQMAAAAAAAASTSMAATAVLTSRFPVRWTTSCSAFPYLPPRLSTSTAFSTSFKKLSGAYYSSVIEKGFCQNHFLCI